jgi:hypothetical protein
MSLDDSRAPVSPLRLGRAVWRAETPGVSIAHEHALATRRGMASAASGCAAGAVIVAIAVSTVAGLVT